MKKLYIVILFILIQHFVNAQYFIVNSISFEGNKTTKEHIILNEISFSIGDSILKENIDNILIDNSTNIYNLQLFHWIKPSFAVHSDSVQIDITFTIQERWYIWPTPILSFADRNLNAWINKMDFNRLDYGLHTAWYNFGGRNEQLKSNIQHGFNRKYELFYNIPQINKKLNIGLDLGVSYYQSHYIDFANFNAKPQTLFLESDFPVIRKYMRTGLINRRNNENIKKIRFEINQQTVSDSVLNLNPNYHLTGINKTYFQIEVNQILNKRKTFSYPLSGSFLEIAFRQRFFLESGETANSRVQLFYSKYIPLTKKSFYSFGINSQYLYANKISTSENISLGYKSNIRGFDFYVIDGQSYFLLKHNLNTTLLGEKTLKFNFIPSSKFNQIPISTYLGVFSDIGYVSDLKYETQNTISNQLLYSFGAGLHIVSYYDQVFVFEYTLNSLKEHGIFVSTKFSF